MKKLTYIYFAVIFCSCSPWTYKYSIIKPVESSELSFSDSLISINFLFSDDEILFALLNKTDKSVQVDWNNSSITINGEAKKVFHAGVKFDERNNQQPLTTVPPGSKIEDLLIPTANVYFDRGWKKRPLIPFVLVSEFEKVKGSEIGVFLPLVFNNQVKEYFFKFKLENYVRQRSQKTNTYDPVYN